MKSVMKIMVVVAFLISSTALAQAETISITNASFESPAIPADYGAGSNYGGAVVEGAAPDGWTAVNVVPGSGVGYEHNGTIGYAAPLAVDGTQAALLKGAGGMYQSISGFNVGTTYTVSFYAAGREHWSSNGADPFQVLVGDTLATATALTFSVSGSNTTTLTPAVASYTADGTATGTWTLYRATFTATNTTQVLEFLSTLTEATNVDATTFIDNVSVTVPEPSSTSLTIVGISGLLAYAWRKRK